MKSKSKAKTWMSRIVVILLAAMLVFFVFSGTIGHAYENVCTIDGVEISSGLYAMTQYSAYSEARTLVADSEQSVFKQKVEGQNAKTWISNRTEELLRRYVYIRKECSARGLTLDYTGQENINQMMQYWTYLENIYAENGIGENSFTRYITMEEMSNQLFYTFFNAGEPLYVPDTVLKYQYSEEYVHIRFLSIPLGDEAQKPWVLEQMAGLVEKLNGGKTLEEIAEKDLKPIYDHLGREFDESTAADSVSTSYVAYQQEDDSVYNQADLDKLKTQSIGDTGGFSMSSTYLLYEIIPTFEDQAAFESYRQTVLYNLKKDVFEDYIKTIYSQYEIEWAFGARWYFRPGKIKES